MSKTAQLSHKMATKNIFVANENEGHQKKKKGSSAAKSSEKFPHYN